MQIQNFLHCTPEIIDFIEGMQVEQRKEEIEKRVRKRREACLQKVDLVGFIAWKVHEERLTGTHFEIQLGKGIDLLWREVGDFEKDVVYLN